MKNFRPIAAAFGIYAAVILGTAAHAQSPDLPPDLQNLMPPQADKLVDATRSELRYCGIGEKNHAPVAIFEYAGDPSRQLALHSPQEITHMVHAGQDEGDSGRLRDQAIDDIRRAIGDKKFKEHARPRLCP